MMIEKRASVCVSPAPARHTNRQDLLGVVMCESSDWPRMENLARSQNPWGVLVCKVIKDWCRGGGHHIVCGGLLLTPGLPLEASSLFKIQTECFLFPPYNKRKQGNVSSREPVCTMLNKERERERERGTYIRGSPSARSAVAPSLTCWRISWRPVVARAVPLFPFWSSGCDT